jgi:bla regulator protein blaR1
VRQTSVIVLLAAALFAQTFEVASVKPSPSDARSTTFSYTAGGGITIKNATLRGILESAYDVASFRILGGPGWIDSDRFDVFAKSESGDEAAGRPDAGTIQRTRLKLQALLADRFQLKAHRDTKEQPIYLLTVAKGGPKLTEKTTGEANALAGMRAECGRMTGIETTMANLARYLMRELGHPVEDRTGLTGKYSFQFEYSPEDKPCEGAGADMPSIFGSIQKTLGLKLEAARGPVEVVVIDSVEKPAAN